VHNLAAAVAKGKKLFRQSVLFVILSLRDSRIVLLKCWKWPAALAEFLREKCSECRRDEQRTNCLLPATKTRGRSLRLCLQEQNKAMKNETMNPARWSWRVLGAAATAAKVLVTGCVVTSVYPIYTE
jgi:hypothetical protein